MRPSKKPSWPTAKSSGRRSVRQRRLFVESLEPRRLLSGAPNFSQAIVFGDSLSDTGNDSNWASLFGYVTTNGRFTSDPTSKPPSAGTGVWHEELETKLGIAHATKSSSGGSNWAYGAATTGSGTQDLGIVHNVGKQVSDYLSATHNIASSTALYMFWAGANDLLDAADNLTGTVNVHALETAASTAETNLENDIKQFAADGAKYFIWPNLPALDQTPYARATYSASVEAALLDGVQAFNNDLASAIQSIRSVYPSEVIYGLDVYTPFTQMLAHTYPGYNFSNVTLAASSVTPVPASADTYLFWDKLHPTEIVHKLLGDTAYNLIASSPLVNAFSVTPAMLTQGTSVQVRWTVSDQNGSGLQRVELWRAPDVGGIPGSWGTSPILTQTVSGIGQVNGAFADTPPSGKWWYSIHVVDVNGVTSTEHDAGFGPTSVTVQRVSKWSGGGTNANWSTAANWGGAAMAANDYVEFAAAAGASANNDLAVGMQFGNVTFDAGAGAFTLNGNAVNLAGDITNNSANKETINLPLVLTGNRTLNAAAGSLTVAGNIGQTGGSYGITKIGSGTLTLSGINTYTGGTLVSAGTVVVTSPSALPQGSALTVGYSGAFVFGASAATSTLAGAFADSPSLASEVISGNAFVKKSALLGPLIQAVHDRAIQAITAQRR